MFKIYKSCTYLPLVLKAALRSKYTYTTQISVKHQTQSLHPDLKHYCRHVRKPYILIHRLVPDCFQSKLRLKAIKIN